MIRVCIVEDESNMVKDLNASINTFFVANQVEYSIKEYDSTLVFLSEYKYEYDLIFMDINLPGIDGITAVKEIRKLDKDVMVIFVTSLAQYAVKGYSVNAFDFIVKPYNYYEFSLVMNRALTNLKNKSDKFIFVKNNQGIKKINLSELKYVELLNRKLIFHTTKGNYEMYGSIKQFAKDLASYNFVLCNVCYLINLKYVTEIYKTKVCLDNEELIISRPKRKEFLDAVNKYFSEGGAI